MNNIYCYECGKTFRGVPYNHCHIKVKLMPNYEGLEPPCYKSDLASGIDLRSAEKGEIYIMPLTMVPIDTGVCVEIPFGYEGQVRPRSGLAMNQQLTVLNTPGTIDADYRGRIIVMLYNASGMVLQTIQRGDRIAQLIINPVMIATIDIVDELSETDRGSGGFGSTGVK